MSRLVGATLVALLVAGCAGTVAPTSLSSTPGAVASTPPNAVASNTPVATAAPSGASPVAQEVDLTGLKVSQVKLTKDEGVEFANMPNRSVGVTNERTDAGALIEFHYEDANGRVVPEITSGGLVGGKSGLVFLLPGLSHGGWFPGDFSGVTVTPVIESVSWFEAPVDGTTEGLEGIGEDCKVDEGVLISCKVTNKNPYAVDVIPLLGYAEGGKLVDIRMAGGTQTIQPGRDDLEYNANDAKEGQAWAMAKKGRVWVPVWTFAADQPAFGTP